MAPSTSFPYLFCTISILLHLYLSESSSTPPAIQPPLDCQRKCGQLDIPYPFGITAGCYLAESYKISCDEATGTAALVTLDWEIDSISIANHTFRHRNFTGIFMPFINPDEPHYFFLEKFPGKSFTISDSRNTFVAVGCDFFVYLVNEATQKVLGSCSSLCNSNETIPLQQLSSCSGLNCCQISYEMYLHNFSIRVQTMSSWTRNGETHCGFFNFVENEYLRENKVKFSTCNNGSFTVPMIHDWAVGNTNCVEARKGDDYSCGENTDCVDFATDIQRYRCKCSRGYTGNPYLLHGCQDFDECLNPKDNNCPTEHRCINTVGSYYCLPNRSRMLALFIPLGIGLSICVLLFVGIGFWTWRKLRNIKERKMKQRFFKKNGGLLLQQQISSNKPSRVFEMNFFKIEELEKATDRFSKNRVLGRGGLGTVYKGMLSDGRIVAVKKSHSIEDKQIRQFVNEVFILSQISHRHIVKLLGCCFESEVPLLVYEYISNGTLFHHIHNDSSSSEFSWEDRIRIIGEIAGALTYLHSYASTAIFHRDIKSSNILLDENYKAVVSDFGISRSVPIDKTHLTTMVGGTFGYLDPQYFRTGQLNDKSDVYAFGVVVTEILTGEKIMSSRTGEVGLVHWFRTAVKEDRLSEVLDPCETNEGDMEQIVVVAKMVKRCLKLNARKRPSMKEVTAELEGLRKVREARSNNYQVVETSLI